MDAEAEVQALLKEHGAVLERTNNHAVWRLPDGRIYSVGQTPSDHRAAQNNLASLRRFLGVKREISKNPDRKEKKGVGRPLYQSRELRPDALSFKHKLKEALDQHQQKRIDLVYNCQHALRVMGGFTFWCSDCRRQLCRDCWTAHCDLLHRQPRDARRRA